MKNKQIKTLELKKVKITNLQSSRIEGGVQNNYTRANCERSQPASICHCHTVVSD